jgi:hypothetical protein
LWSALLFEGETDSTLTASIRCGAYSFSVPLVFCFPPLFVLMTVELCL